MNIQEQVKQAKSPQEALVILARGLDSLAALIEGQPQPPAPDPWGTWDSQPAPDTGELEARIAELNERAGTEDGEQRQATEAEIRLLRDQLRPVTAAPTRDDGKRASIEVVGADGTTQVDLPVVSEEKQERRRAFAKDELVLDTHFPNLGLVDAYAKGGPLLLYYSDRDFVMGLPAEWKAAMVRDVSEESPREALEMGRDILKDASPGTDYSITAGAIDAIRDTL